MARRLTRHGLDLDLRQQRVERLLVMVLGEEIDHRLDDGGADAVDVAKRGARVLAPHGAVKRVPVAEMAGEAAGVSNPG